MENRGRKESLEDAVEKQREQIKEGMLDDGGDDAEYQNALDYIYGLIEADIKDEYLVNGAIITCEMATDKVLTFDGIPFLVNQASRTRLKVNRKGKIVGEPQATVFDCKKGENIVPFGNCLAEVSNKKKEELKADSQAQIAGTCRHLMWLEDRWEKTFEGENGLFCYEKSPTLTMNSVLFCKHGGAFIYPLTSGQRITKYDYELAADQLTKEDILLIHKNQWTKEEVSLILRYQLSLDEYRTSQEWGLEENQLVIFKEMREYFEDEPDLKNGNVIFTFEGLGSYSGPANSDHPNGQFGAIFIYCKDGKIVCGSDNCSTLPDHIETATIEDGTYYAVYKLHNQTYQAIQLWTSKTDDTVPACYHDKENKQADNRNADGVNMHAAGDLKERAVKPWSMGCLTISVTDYYYFGVNAGFIGQRNDGNLYNTYSSIKDLKGLVQPEGTYWGHVVVNREYMDKEERERFLTGYE